MAGEEFDGIPLEELPIDEVVWSPDRAKHIRTRTERNGPREINIEPEWATEAALDPNRLVRRGTGTESVEVLGYSPSAQRVLLVWIYNRTSTDRHLARRQRDRRRMRAAYWEGRGDEGED